MVIGNFKYDIKTLSFICWVFFLLLLIIPLFLGIRCHLAECLYFCKEGERLSKRVVYKYNFAIIKMKNGGYVVYNMNKPFDTGHTHQGNFNTCISLVKLIHNRQLPKNRSVYFINSLCRLAEDKEYIKELKEIDIDLNYKSLMEDAINIDFEKCYER